MKHKNKSIGFHNGTNGEFIQGQLSNGTFFHVTFPINIGVKIEVIPNNLDFIRFPIGMSKLEKAARETIALLSIENIGLDIIKDSSLLPGKGMGSSTADIAATSKAVAGLFYQTLSVKDIARIASKIETSDGTMYKGVVCFEPKKGELMVDYKWVPPLISVTLDVGAIVITSECTSRKYTEKQQLDCDSFLKLFSQSMRQKDLNGLGQATTRSADLNHEFIPYREYPIIKDLAEKNNGIGVSVAHTGSLISILFAEKDMDYAVKTIDTICDLKIGDKIYMFKPNCWHYDLCFEKNLQEQIVKKKVIIRSIGMSGHGGNRRVASEKYGIPLQEIMDFSSNINPLGLHHSIEKLINTDMDSLLYYPDPDYKELKTVLSRYYSIEKENILPGNGSVELIYLLAQTLQPKQVLIPEPNFSEYEHSLKDITSQITRLLGEEENLFKIPVSTIIPHIPGHQVLYVSNPNNPIGYSYSREELLQMLQVCEKNQCYFLVDEAFIHFSKDGNRNTMRDFTPEYRYLLVLQSLTKIFAIPGIRLGIGFANKELIRRLASRQIPWSVNCFARKIGVSIIKETEYIKQTINFIDKQRELMVDEISKIPGLKLFPSKVNYLVCKLTGGQNLASLEEYLGKNRIIIRNCSNYYGLNDQYFRIAIRKEEDNKQLIAWLKEFAKFDDL